MTKIIDESKTQLSIKHELIPFFEHYDTLEVKESVSRSDYKLFKEKVSALTSEIFKSSLSGALAAIEQTLEENEEKALNQEKTKIETQKELEQGKAEETTQTEVEKDTTKENKSDY